MTLNIADRTGAQQNYDAGNGRTVLLFVCHDTSNPQDRNDVDAATAKAGVEATIRWLTLPSGGGGGGVSAHYLIGPEPMGAPIYRLVRESDIAWHAGGNPPQFPSRWLDTSTNTTYTTYDVNVHSIGVEVYRRPGDPIGPKQRAAMVALVQDVVSRYPAMLKLNHIVSHASIQANRADGRDWVAIAGTAAQSTVGANKVPTPPKPLPPVVNPNPKSLAVTPDTLAAIKARGDVADTNTQFFGPTATNPGLLERSMTWAHAADSTTHIYVGYMQSDGRWQIHTYKEI